MKDAGNKVIHSIFDRFFRLFITKQVLCHWICVPSVQFEDQNNLKDVVYDCMAISSKILSLNPHKIDENDEHFFSVVNF